MTALSTSPARNSIEASVVHARDVAMWMGEPDNFENILCLQVSAEADSGPVSWGSIPRAVITIHGIEVRPDTPSSQAAKVTNNRNKCSRR